MSDENERPEDAREPGTDGDDGGAPPEPAKPGRGRPKGSKKGTVPEAGQKPVREPRRTAGETRDPRSALRRRIEEAHELRAQILIENPNSDVVDLPKPDALFDKPPAPTIVPIPVEVFETILPSTMGMLAAVLGVSAEYDEAAAKPEYKEATHNCAEAWHRVSRYYDVMNEKHLVIMMAGVTTANLAKPIATAYLAKKKNGGEARILAQPSAEA